MYPPVGTPPESIAVVKVSVMALDPDPKAFAGILTVSPFANPDPPVKTILSIWPLVETFTEAVAPLPDPVSFVKLTGYAVVLATAPVAAIVPTDPVSWLDGIYPCPT